jgi:hypothetical protein
MGASVSDSAIASRKKQARQEAGLRRANFSSAYCPAGAAGAASRGEEFVGVASTGSR